MASQARQDRHPPWCRQHGRLRRPSHQRCCGRLRDGGAPRIANRTAGPKPALSVIDALSLALLTRGRLGPPRARQRPTPKIRANLASGPRPRGTIEGIGKVDSGPLRERVVAARFGVTERVFMISPAR